MLFDWEHSKFKLRNKMNTSNKQAKEKHQIYTRSKEKKDDTLSEWVNGIKFLVTMDESMICLYVFLILIWCTRSFYFCFCLLKENGQILTKFVLKVFIAIDIEIKILYLSNKVHSITFFAYNYQSTRVFCFLKLMKQQTFFK